MSTAWLRSVSTSSRITRLRFSSSREDPSVGELLVAVSVALFATGLNALDPFEEAGRASTRAGFADEVFGLSPATSRFVAAGACCSSKARASRNVTPASSSSTSVEPRPSRDGRTIASDLPPSIAEAVLSRKAAIRLPSPLSRQPAEFGPKWRLLGEVGGVEPKERPLARRVPSGRVALGREGKGREFRGLGGISSFGVAERRASAILVLRTDRIYSLGKDLTRSFRPK